MPERDEAPDLPHRGLAVERLDDPGDAQHRYPGGERGRAVLLGQREHLDERCGCDVAQGVDEVVARGAARAS